MNTFGIEKNLIMSPAARSIYYFSFYLYLVGLTLIVIPNIFLKTLRFPETNEVWIRIIGVLALCLGFYYHRSAVYNNAQFIKLTIPVRVFVCLAFVAFVILGYTIPMLILIGVIDLAGAAWTYFALKIKQPSAV
jgi:hypothetical protein